jgi:hypothetical protein
MWNYHCEKSSKRKWQLFACACCRRIWHLLAKQPEAFRQLLEMCEQAAEGLITSEQLQDAWESDEIVSADWSDETLAVLAATGEFRGWHLQSAQQLAAAATGQPDNYDLDPTNPAIAAELEAQTNLLRCIIGNPFRPVTISPAVLTWHDAVVVRLAQAAYEERYLPAGTLDNSRLAILADCLEEAGCTSEEILSHLRGPGPHVRGCWAIDLCLGKS